MVGDPSGSRQRVFFFFSAALTLPALAVALIIAPLYSAAAEPGDLALAEPIDSAPRASFSFDPPDLELDEEIEAGYHSWVEGRRIGDSAKADYGLGLILAAMKRLGISSLDDLSGIAIGLGRAELERSRISAALELSSDALKLGPRDYRAFLFAARANFARDRFDLKTPAALLWDCARAIAEDESELLRFGADYLGLFFLALALSFGLMALIFLAQRWRAPVSEFLSLIAPGAVGSKSARLAALALIVLALALAGWIMAGLLALIALWPASSRAHRIFFLLFFALAWSAPALVGSLAHLKLSAFSSDRAALHEIASGNWDQKTKERIEDLLARRPSDPVVLFAAGSLASRSGEPARALELFEKALSAPTPSGQFSSRALTYIGNLYFSAGEPARAVEYYRKATEADPENLLAVFNLSNALLELIGEEKEAARVYQMALEIDKGGVARLSELGATPAESIEYLRLRPDEINLLDAVDGLSAERLTETLWSVWFAPFSLAGYRLILIALTLLLLARVALASRADRSHQICHGCGAGYVRLDEDKFPSDNCSDCALTIGGSSSSIETSAREAQRAKMARHIRAQSRAARWGDIVYPGLGRVYAGLIGSGALFLFISTSFAIAIFREFARLADFGALLDPVGAALLSWPLFLSALIFWFLSWTVFRKSY